MTMNFNSLKVICTLSVPVSYCLVYYVMKKIMQPTFDDKIKDSFVGCFTLRPMGRQCRKHVIEGVCGKYCSAILISYIVDKINACQRRIDLCMYHMTLRDISDALVAAHKRGVVVRCITDQVMMKVTGSKFPFLQKIGIPVKAPKVNSQTLLHHKYMLVDIEILLGSLNYTVQGFTNNFEVCSVLKDSYYTDYQAQFDKLWHAFQEVEDI